MAGQPRRNDDRRSDARRPVGFTMAFAPADSGEPKPDALPAQGWMLNISASGGIFLSDSCQTPAVGELLELTPPASPRGAGVTLPRRARVARVEGEGITRRVAVRFEAPPCTALAPRSAAALQVTH